MSVKEVVKLVKYVLGLAEDTELRGCLFSFWMAIQCRKW